MRTPEEQLVDASLEIGKALLLAGGEVTRVEDTITRILHAYGMREIGVFTITSLIEVTACTPDGDEIVKARRIAGSYATDLDRVERLNALSREICAQCPPPQTLAARIEAIRRPRTEAAWISYAGAVLTGFLGCVLVRMGVGVHLDKILIGCIMLTIPGISITYAMRDMLLGESITGLFRFIESLLIAATIAGGFLLSTVVAEGVLG